MMELSMDYLELHLSQLRELISKDSELAKCERGRLADMLRILVDLHKSKEVSMKLVIESLKNPNSDETPKLQNNEWEYQRRKGIELYKTLTDMM